MKIINTNIQWYCLSMIHFPCVDIDIQLDWNDVWTLDLCHLEQMTAKWTWALWQLVMQQPKCRMRQGHYFVQSTLYTLQDPPFLCSWHFLPAMISMRVYVFLTLPLCEPREAKWASRQILHNFKSRSDATAWAPKARRPMFGPLCIHPTILPF